MLSTVEANRVDFAHSDADPAENEVASIMTGSSQDRNTSRPFAYFNQLDSALYAVPRKNPMPKELTCFASLDSGIAFPSVPTRLRETYIEEPSPPPVPKRRFHPHDVYHYPPLNVQIPNGPVYQQRSFPIYYTRPMLSYEPLVRTVFIMNSPETRNFQMHPVFSPYPPPALPPRVGRHASGSSTTSNHESSPHFHRPPRTNFPKVHEPSAYWDKSVFRLAGHLDCSCDYVRANTGMWPAKSWLQQHYHSVLECTCPHEDVHNYFERAATQPGCSTIALLPERETAILDDLVDSTSDEDEIVSRASLERRRNSTLQFIQDQKQQELTLQGQLRSEHHLEEPDEDNNKKEFHIKVMDSGPRLRKISSEDDDLKTLGDCLLDDSVWMLASATKPQKQVIQIAEPTELPPTAEEDQESCYDNLQEDGRAYEFEEVDKMDYRLLKIRELDIVEERPEESDIYDSKSPSCDHIKKQQHRASPKQTDLLEDDGEGWLADSRDSSVEFDSDERKVSGEERQSPEPERRASQINISSEPVSPEHIKQPPRSGALLWDILRRRKRELIEKVSQSSNYFSRRPKSHRNVSFC
ncbi:Protein unc-13 C [Cichlidogyrus casuarinus]|uniref:Protein unc-13 C n=1 Tax=Cichlidogyrus casuarinus TaxID=1844966 RepID=A0ABD2PVX2_9PLAT